MVNYEFAKIYKIVDNTNGNIYIGSTCEPTLARRLANHRRHYKRYLENKKNFITSFNILKNDNYEIVLLEECKDITTKDQLHKRERFYIENNICVNKYIPSRTDKEYYETNKEQLKQYRQDNKEKISEYNIQYKQDNKQKIMERNKAYQEKNKEKINECRRERYRLKSIKNEE